MATITIRNLDAGTVKALKARAKANNRSLEAELRHVLAQAARRLEPLDLLLRADRIAAMTPPVPQTDSVKLLREDRNR
jgi:antitoxin FitA